MLLGNYSRRPKKIRFEHQWPAAHFHMLLLKLLAVMTYEQQRVFYSSLCLREVSIQNRAKQLHTVNEHIKPFSWSTVGSFESQCLSRGLTIFKFESLSLSSRTVFDFEEHKFLVAS